MRNMKQSLYILLVIAIAAGCMLLSKMIFDAVIDSDLPLFWKWILLRG